ncbi:phosphatase PAP2 family protein [Nocardioides flavus (ex Wang et al. 2016)]|uniref:phosphatase PAP2 family protein n=1 Tax=Nocardioides flavus (ex Wang et al. 2016) TaxID=2058780 RepID=UPI001E3AAA49|nr:phosphatase PAP2 family protein [Nocardioides flavus (ex Wang et al. 2016)]
MASGTVVWGQTQEGWFSAVNDFARSTPWLHTPARMYAEYGVVLFAGLLLFSWLLARRDGDLRRVTAALWAPAGALIAIGVNQFLVAAVAEERPYTAMPQALVLVSRSTDYSFPSDHAVMAGAVVVGVVLATRRLGRVTAALAVVMALTRVYVGAHFPLDVAAGLAVGAIVAVVSYLAARPALSWLILLLLRTPVRLLVRAHPEGMVRQ